MFRARARALASGSNGSSPPRAGGGGGGGILSAARAPPPPPNLLLFALQTEKEQRQATFMKSGMTEADAEHAAVSVVQERFALLDKAIQTKCVLVYNASRPPRASPSSPFLTRFVST